MEEIETTFNNLIDDSTLCESKVIPFASLLGPGIAGIDWNVYNRGKIYIYDWEYGLTYQAASLNEFCKQLIFTDASELRKQMLNLQEETKWII
ncbi:hypothetical protein QNI16_02170 [Cytophagaceae bacterium YF14B1]|uniref:Uncharacterized protein n=1 Tax=Xanthocytophaga flava TaxID=3048013 RepID=A0AAE3QIJ4_9BACT|nr:hypothetical protein [Xanthocytophaga flavus]MDJ1479271.1 hypothetical protein [Xanthocytophaga flavus]